MNISFAWVILCLGIGGVWKYRQEAKRTTRRRKKAQMANITKGAVHLPTWACVPEGGETAAWLNNALEQMWPYIERMARKIIKESVEPELQKSLPSSLKSLYFETIDLGRKAPCVTNIKTYSSKEDANKRSEFIIDMDLIYRGDAQLKLAVKGIQLGVTDFQLRGPLRIILKPLLADYCGLIGGITIFFRKRPKLSFDLTNLLNVLDFPGLKNTLRDIIDDAIASFAVLPNRIVVPLAGSIDVTALQYPMPEGVFQVEVVEARELVKTDLSLIGSGSSDPYALVEIGAQVFRTQVKNNDLNPVWKETFEAFVDHLGGQDLRVTVQDKDVSSKDEEIGSIDIGIAGIVRENRADVWVPLEGVPQGQIRLRASWLIFSDSPLDLNPPEEHFSVAALFVKVISAENLPNPNVARKVLCKVTIGGESLKTFESSGAEKIEWKQPLRFLLKNPFSQMVRIDVVDAKGDRNLGRLMYDASPLIDEPKMTFEDRFRLEDSGEYSTLTCKFTLLALKASDMVDAPDKKTTKAGLESITYGIEERDDCAKDQSYSHSSPGMSSVSSASISDKSDNKTDPSPSGSLYFINKQEYTTARGEITISLAYNHRRNRFVVKVLQATGLVTEAPNAKTNPYVRIYLLPDRSKKSLRKTYVFPRSRNPVFDETFEYAIGLDQLRERKLEVVVKKNGKAVLPIRGSKDLIGKTILELSELNLTDGVTLNCEIRK